MVGKCSIINRSLLCVISRYIQSAPKRFISKSIARATMSRGASSALSSNSGIKRLPSGRFNLFKRGKIAKGYFADLVLFDPQKIIDTASFNNPKSQALGIEKVWVNGVLSFVAHANEETIIKYGRAGRFLAREAKQ